MKFLKLAFFLAPFGESKIFKPRCYFDQKKLKNLKRIELWREFKYPVQCQE